MFPGRYQNYCKCCQHDANMMPICSRNNFQITLKQNGANMNLNNTGNHQTRKDWWRETIRKCSTNISSTSVSRRYLLESMRCKSWDLEADGRWRTGMRWRSRPPFLLVWGQNRRLELAPKVDLLCRCSPIFAVLLPDLAVAHLLDMVVARPLDIVALLLCSDRVTCPCWEPQEVKRRIVLLVFKKILLSSGVCYSNLTT